jgi:SAM-dependent methyltransferase
MDRTQRLSETRASWNVATRAHNAHKKDQAAFLRDGGSTLYDDELALLGDINGKRVLHTLCNAGQDTLSLAKLGADVTGVDLSDEAIAFAKQLSIDSRLPVRFVHSEVFEYLENNTDQFDVAFGSYGCLVWIDDLTRFFKGVASRLVPGGRAVYLEFHPLAWSFDENFQLKDPYFAPGRLFSEPVGDYVGEAGGALSPSGHVETGPYVNPHKAHAYQHTVADIVTALINADLKIEILREYPHSNGCRMHAGLIPLEGNRFTTPPRIPSLPLMLGVVGRRPP